MSINGKAFVCGAYEHPDRVIPDKSVARIHFDVAIGALTDAGLVLDDIDGYLCDGQDGLDALVLAEYIGLRNLKYIDTTNLGGCSYVSHVAHAAAAIAVGKCQIALITMGGRPRQTGRHPRPDGPGSSFEDLFGLTAVAGYALAARRHMYEFGTTSGQLAEIKVAASHHAQFNQHALLPKTVSVQEVIDSPLLSDPLHRLDCCVVTDGGGAVIVASPEIAREISRPLVKILGHGESPKHSRNGRVDLTYTGAVWSGPRAFDEARVSPIDIDYASIYDSFTITVLETVEDLGFCPKGEGGSFVIDGALIAPNGKLPMNTDGGGLCNNHPANRGGMIRTIEAVRQLRGEADPRVQVPNCQLGIVHGTGGSIATRAMSATLILGRDDG